MTDLQPAPSRRGLLAGGAAALLAGTAGPELWLPPTASAASGVVPSGVHLMYGADARHRMALSWATPHSVKKPRLEIGRDLDYGMSFASDSRSSKGVSSIYHHTTVRGLQPDTKYQYRITQQGGRVHRGHFTTAPAKPRPFRFAAFGDMGVNSDGATFARMIRRMDAKFAFMVGDLSYADSSGGTGSGGPSTQNFAVWDQWLRQIQPSASAVPWMTTVGNHEMEEGQGELGYKGYLDRFELPGNGVAGAPVTYSFVHGNVGFIALDGNDASFEIARNQDYLGNRQDAWLVSRLMRMRKNPAIDFVVVGFHNCMFCTNLVHGSDGGNRSRWESIFDRFSVDMVVNGHNHCYERTHPLRDGAPVRQAPRGAVIDSAKGTTYVTAGGAGQTAYPSGGLPTSYVVDEGGNKVPEPTTYSALTYQDHSIAFLDVAPRNKQGVATMKLRAVTPQGRVLDTVTMRRTHAPSAA